MHAVIVIGKDSFDDPKGRFSTEAEKLLEFFEKCDVLIGSRLNVLSKLEEIFIEKRKEDICLFYIGHGQENGWPLDGIRDWELIEYERLAFVLAGHYGNLIFVNDCCFAGAAKKAMEHHSGEHLFIAAMPENEMGFTFNFLNYILNDWRRGRMFSSAASLDNPNFTPVVEGNQNLQKLLFSKIKSPAF